MAVTFINPYLVAPGTPPPDADLALQIAPWKETGFSNNDPVATATDFSTHGRNFTQATSGSRPLYKTGIMNGQPAFLFDGVDDFLSASAFMSGDAELFYVLKIISTSELCGAYKFDGNTDASHISFAGTVYSSFGSGTRFSYTPSPTSNLTNGMLHQVIAKAGSSNWKLLENGNNVKSTQSPSQSWGTGSHLIGASSVGSNGSPAGGTNQWYHGYLLDFRIYSSPRSTAQQNVILAEYASLFGLSLTSF